MVLPLANQHPTRANRVLLANGFDSVHVKSTTRENQLYSSAGKQATYAQQDVFCVVIGSTACIDPVSAGNVGSWLSNSLAGQDSVGTGR